MKIVGQGNHVRALQIRKSFFFFEKPESFNLIHSSKSVSVLLLRTKSRLALQMSGLRTTCVENPETVRRKNFNGETCSTVWKVK